MKHQSFLTASSQAEGLKKRENAVILFLASVPSLKTSRPSLRKEPRNIQLQRKKVETNEK